MITPVQRLTVALITKDRPHDLQECLESFINQLTPGDECIIVDSSATQETRRYIYRYNRHSPIVIRYIHEPRRGFPIARNRALRACRTAWITFTDDDCIVDKQWISAFKTAIKKRPEAAAVSGLSLTLYPANSIALSCELNENYWKTNGREGNRITDFETLDNKNIAYNIDFLKKHRIAYDVSRAKRFGGASDDCDLGMQIQAAGGRAFYEPKARVYHKDPISFSVFTSTKIRRTLAHATYEEKWKQYRESLLLQKCNKWRFIAGFVKQKRLSVLMSLQIMLYLFYTFLLIRYTKSMYRLKKPYNCRIQKR
jgi:glycosyltransferase involved in cell wall biosynthesis